jgi:hypothetical protein
MFWSKNKVVEWNCYYPDLNSASSEQKKYYYFRLENFNQWNYIDLWDNLSYIFYYVYSIFNEFIKYKDISKLESDALKVIEWYENTKVYPYLVSRMCEAYLHIWDFESAYEVQKNNANFDLWDFLFYVFNGIKIKEDSKLFLELFGSSYLTKYWKENIEWVQKVLDVFLQDFYEENGKGFVSFFCQDFQKEKLLEEDIMKYKKFYRKEQDFYKNKWYDEHRYYANPNNYYINSYRRGIFWGIPLFDYNRDFGKWAYTSDLWWWISVNFSVHLSMEQYEDNNFHKLSNYIKTPWYLIMNAFKSYAEWILRECENTYREECWIPKIWEWRISETELYYKIKKAFPNDKVVHHWNPERIWRQHLDIYFPEKNIWIEYQWKQHQEPVDYFWWEEAYKKQKQRDLLKKKKCEKNWCKLIYVYEWYNLNEVLDAIANNSVLYFT